MLTPTHARLASQLLAAILLLTLFATGCSSLKRYKVLQDCEFAWTGARVEDAGLLETQLAVDLNIHNPNEIDAALDRLDLTLLVDDIVVAEARNEAAFSVAPGGSHAFTVRLNVNHLTSLDALTRLVSGQAREYRVMIKVYIATSWRDMVIDKTLVRESF